MKPLTLIVISYKEVGGEKRDELLFISKNPNRVWVKFSTIGGNFIFFTLPSRQNKQTDQGIYTSGEVHIRSGLWFPHAI